MIKEDYVMKMIDDMVRFLAKVLFNKDTITYEVSEEESKSSADILYEKLLGLTDEGKINEAENLLYEELDLSDKRYLELAIDFYRRLNEFDNDYLESNNYSREEIDLGIRTIADKYGLSV